MLTQREYLAVESGPKGIRAHPTHSSAILPTAATGINRYDEFMVNGIERAPARALVNIEHAGMEIAIITADYAALITGDTMVIHDKPMSCSRIG